MFCPHSTLETPAVYSVPFSAEKASCLPVSTPEERVRHARTHSGLTIVQLASAIGVHRDYYRMFEANISRSNPNTIRRFCLVTGVDLSWILYGDSPPPSIQLHAPTIGQRIREFRERNHISKAQFARDVFHVPKKPAILCWENNQNLPELQTLMRIADAYQLDASSFIP